MSKNDISIIRSEEYYKYHVINTDDVLKYGLNKAAILGNIDKFHGVKKKDLHEKFPYIDREIFYKYLEELILEGELQEVPNE